MRISDWSSDVCSSDLFGLRESVAESIGIGPVRCNCPAGQKAGFPKHKGTPAHRGKHRAITMAFTQPTRERSGDIGGDWRLERGRSEEHTSELQSLMRISYAVFCLKKKKTHKLNQLSRIECEHKITQ